jgi:hypothetical protein
MLYRLISTRSTQASMRDLKNDRVMPGIRKYIPVSDPNNNRTPAKMHAGQ